MLKGFREFILRGNVIDLAVAVVIGAAFSALVAAISASIITPVLNAFGGTDSIGLGFYLQADNPETFVNIGAVISAAITFLITAAVVYFVFVAPMNSINEARRRKEGITEEEEEAPDIVLLTEIRDLLARREGGGS
jgi:large conductance mechanosensitive channel